MTADRKATDKKVAELHQVLVEELQNRKPAWSLRSLSIMDRQRQGLALVEARYFTAILQHHILDGAQSVVFTIEVTEDHYLLRFCCPLNDQDYRRLQAAGYVPPLRSKLYLAVGLEPSTPRYAYSSVKLSPYSSVIDQFDAMFVLGKELENLLKCKV